MGLAEDRAEFTKLQTVIHVLAVEAKLDFELPWSQQEPMTIAKISRVVRFNKSISSVLELEQAAERHDYLCAKRFPRHWATQSILQHYLNSVRAYKSGKANPSSGVSRRRARATKIGRREAAAAGSSHQNPRIILSPPDSQQSNSRINSIYVQWIWITTLAVKMTYLVLLLNRVSRSTPSDEEESDNGSTNDNPRDLTVALKTTRMGMRTI
ncbi:hypothetical protein B0H16DRAFT_1483758 [Mycena metata]|uniref:Uncharacterized protein n=1 Tax=Mycena metata TaxID=1033252 RepID=A0AAD7GQU3_9AGAR|nr:hypothetical protein B0H16DRAFT_1483758 [Mycena metata]